MLCCAPEVLKNLENAVSSGSTLCYPQSELEYTKGSVALKKNDIFRAFTHFLKALEFNPRNVSAVIMASRCLTMDNQRDEAARLLETARKNSPTFKIYHELSAVYDFQGESLRNISLWQEYISRYPEQSRGYLKLADLYFQAQSFEATAQNLEKAAALDRNPAPLWFRLGECYEKLKRKTDCIIAFRRCLESEPDTQLRIRTYKKLSQISLYQKNYMQASEYSEKLVSLKPDSEEFESLGDIYLQCGKKDSALAAYRRSGELNSLNFLLSVKAACVSYIFLRKAKDSAEWLSRAVSVNPAASELLNWLSAMADGKDVSHLMKSYWEQHIDLKIMDAENLFLSDPAEEIIQSVSATAVRLEGFVSSASGHICKELGMVKSQMETLLFDMGKSMEFLRESVLQAESFRTGSADILRDMDSICEKFFSGYKKQGILLEKEIRRFSLLHDGIVSDSLNFKGFIDELAAEIQLFSGKIRHQKSLPPDVRKNEILNLSAEFQKRIFKLIDRYQRL